MELRDEASGLYPPRYTSDTELHKQQLNDYRLMLWAMLKKPPVALQESTLIEITSPMHVASRDGLNMLWEILLDRDCIEWFRTAGINPMAVKVVRQQGKYVYLAPPKEGTSVTLDFAGTPKWKLLLPRIERAATALGGELNSDRTISLDAMYWFYGAGRWRPENPQERAAAIATIREKIATHVLQLEDGFDLLQLASPLPDELNLTADELLVANDAEQRAIMRKDVLDTVREFLPEGGSSPITHLAASVLSNVTVEQVRATPGMYLQKILQTPEAQQFGLTLLVKLDWYGGSFGEQSSPRIQTRLIAQALQLWLGEPAGEDAQAIAGYALHSSSNWGKTYGTIRLQFEKHLVDTHRAASEKEAIVIRRLLLNQFPAEFRIADIPDNLAWRGSVVWVNFINGVNFIKAEDPRLLDRMTFQQLVNIPLSETANTADSAREAMALARLLPTLDWAETHGVMAHKSRDLCTPQDIESALAALEKHSSELHDAITQLNQQPTERLVLARERMLRLFDKDAFHTDGRKLARPAYAHGRSHEPHFLNGKGYDYFSFIDVLASDKFAGEKWFITETDGKTLTKSSIKINARRQITSDWPGLKELNPDSAFRPQMPNVNGLFEGYFDDYLGQTKTAYATLIKSLLATLPLSDRQVLEFGEVKIFSLRMETDRMRAADETPEKVLRLRARNGLILQATLKGDRRFYEMLPGAGVIRHLQNFDVSLIGPAANSIATCKEGCYLPRHGHKLLPFDWDAHATGSEPKKDASCFAIIDQLGSAIEAGPEQTDKVPLAGGSTRALQISRFIADELLFVDPVALRKQSRGQTAFDRLDADAEQFLGVIKIIVPFWSSIEDLMSDDRDRRAMGAFGIFFDILSFGLPFGKFAAGSLRVVAVAGRFGLRSALPVFSKITRTLVISIVGALNPLDGILQLFKTLATRLWRGAKFAFFTLEDLSRRVQELNALHSLPRVSDASRWTPMTVGDRLARVKGVDDIAVRNVAPDAMADYRLIDPLSSMPYGPAIPNRYGGVSPGPSHYRSLGATERHTTIEVPKSTRVQELLEVDGSTTLLLDDVPYRLDASNVARRADLIDFDETFKALLCRPARAPKSGTCQTNFVTRSRAPTPAIGSFDETKGWAPWFGDVTYIPIDPTRRLRTTAIAGLSSVQAVMDFRKGIYGRLKISVPVGEGQADQFLVGAIIVESKVKDAKYVYARMNAGDFFVAELAKSQSVRGPLTFNKASTLAADLKLELDTVFVGSLMANNMARIHGIPNVERALKTMNDIAIPIGGHVNPPDTLKLLKVDTSPAEAVLFDHSTRMIVSTLETGAASWSRSRTASEAFRQRTANIFDTLFAERQTIKITANADLKINQTMNKLHRLIPSRFQQGNPRNIAFADVVTSTGKREVYVSVSGAQGLTGELPLFKHPFAADKVIVGDTTYFNIDFGQSFSQTSLNLTSDGRVLAVPHTIKNIDAYTPTMTSRPTSLDSEAKLISVLRQKYPDNKMLKSVDVATTMPPCNSCSVVIKEFGYNGTPSGLQVLWK